MTMRIKGPSRSESERRVRDHYGLPGAGIDDAAAADLVLETVRGLGFSALSDEGLDLLAKLHLELDVAETTGDEPAAPAP